MLLAGRFLIVRYLAAVALAFDTGCPGIGARHPALKYHPARAEQSQGDDRDSVLQHFRKPFSPKTLIITFAAHLAQQSVDPIELSICPFKATIAVIRGRLFKELT